ncbi:hypothetical protein EYF80_038644 [Liparis tanakae]|uniref:Secreted protein n=1 Tax=Liparis tanakae TaxID=230148 RepID=A0A4Z2GEN1_9TELE|nr:hypothetical protein EYF80_038644 [Liparis tanakae]
MRGTRRPAIILLTHLFSRVAWSFSSSQSLLGEKSHSISSALMKYCTIWVGARDWASLGMSIGWLEGMSVKTQGPSSSSSSSSGKDRRRD